MTEPAVRNAFKTYGLKVVDSVYNASVYSVIAYSALLFLFAIIGMAIYFKLIYVPEFHPW